MSSLQINKYLNKMPDSGWITPTLKNGWVTEPTSGNTVQYRKIGNIVYITGACQAGSGSANNQEIFTLPLGFRPKGSYLSLIQRSRTSTCRILINYRGAGSGVVAFEGDISDASEVSLFNISFPVD